MPFAFLYAFFIAFLMISKLPVFSGKRVGKRVPPEMVVPVFGAVVVFFALLISYPWEVLAIGTLLYLACLPLGLMSYREHERKSAAPVETVPEGEHAPALAPSVPANDGPERPARLN